ncbi:MAG: class I SAM-dependent methyltransferase [Saprospiraceae bacterium]
MKRNIEKHQVDPTFEQAYLKARAKEQRILSAAQIKQLPYLSNHPLAKEWQLRQKSTERFLAYVRNKEVSTLMDLGCGNGWLTHKLAPLVDKIEAIDVNQTELEQAAEVLKAFTNVQIKCCDIFSTQITNRFDLILVNGAVQYFPDFSLLMERLFELLTATGEIHILDSPFYHTKDIANAKARSDAYYESIDTPNMKPFYHHHSWDDLFNFKYQKLYDPSSFLRKLGNRIGRKDSPFPWIKISHAEIIV